MKQKIFCGIIIMLMLLQQPYLSCVADLDEPQPQPVSLDSVGMTQQPDNSQRKININGPGGVKFETDNPEIESVFASYLPLFFIVGLFAAFKYITTWNSSPTPNRSS